MAAREPRSASDRETLAPLGAAGGDHGAATAGLHADEKPVRARAFDFRRLVSAFGCHCSSLAVAATRCGCESAGVVRDGRRFIARVSSRKSSSLLAEAPGTASRTRRHRGNVPRSPAHEDRRDKRGIRRDAARHCQTAREPPFGAGLAAVSHGVSVDKPGDRVVDNSMVQRAIKSPLHGVANRAGCKRPLPQNA